MTPSFLKAQNFTLVSAMRTGWQRKSLKIFLEDFDQA